MKNEPSRGDAINECGPDPGIADRLRVKRTAIVREAHHRIKKIDRALALVVTTDAEAVMAEAREVLESA
jgi:hypothetical protein